MAQLQWLTHNDRRVLLLDFSQHSEKRIEEIVREVQQVITAQSPGSVLVLADFTGVTFSTETLKQIAQAAAADRRYVARTAWVGAESLTAIRFNWLQDASGREIHRFTTREEALAFLTAH